MEQKPHKRRINFTAKPENLFLEATKYSLKHKKLTLNPNSIRLAQKANFDDL